MDALRWIASLTTMAAGLVLAARIRPRLMGWAFVVLALASMAWVLIGYFAEEYALMAQNAVLTLINVFGVYRRLIWKARSEGAPGTARTSVHEPEPARREEAFGATENPRTTARIAGHPIHPMLIPIAFLVATLVSDLIYEHRVGVLEPEAHVADRARSPAVS